MPVTRDLALSSNVLGSANTRNFEISVHELREMHTSASIKSAGYDSGGGTLSHSSKLIDAVA